MKTILTILTIFISTISFSQDTCKRVRATLVFNGYADGNYLATVYNNTECPTDYYLRDPAGNFYPAAIFIEPMGHKTISFNSPLVCGRMSVLPDEQCKNFGFKCPLDYIYTESDICSTLDIGLQYIYSRPGYVEFRYDDPIITVQYRFTYKSGRVETFTPQLKQKGYSWFFNY